MVEVAVADNPFFSASAVELDRFGPSYTVDTLRSFLSAFQRATLYFIVGLDAFRELHTWKDHFTLPELCNFIVTSRPGIPTPPPQALLPVAFQPIFWYDSVREVHRHLSTNHTLVFYEIEGLNISASAIRDKIRQGKSVRYLIPPSVGSYIAQHSLYHPERLTR
jgi:nicotinate-nucleotide adenylyltransferase